MISLNIALCRRRHININTITHKMCIYRLQIPFMCFRMGYFPWRNSYNKYRHTHIHIS